MAYLFTSERLGFRSWSEDDVQPFAKMNADPRVMQYFPSTLSLQETKSLITRLKEMYKSKGYCYFAVDELDSSNFIGFIGLAYQTYEASFTPCVDIGWRLAPDFWGKGYATEGALSCLAYAKDVIGLKEVLSVATSNNTSSIRVMEKIGMTYYSSFDHPALLDHPELKECVLYRVQF